MSDQYTLTFLTQYFRRALPSLAVLSSIIDSVTCHKFFILISSYCALQIFSLNSVSINFFPAACKTFKFILISLVVTVNVGKISVKTEWGGVYFSQTQAHLVSYDFFNYSVFLVGYVFLCSGVCLYFEGESYFVCRFQ